MELIIMRKRGSTSHLYMINICIIFLLTHQCVGGRISRQHFFKASFHHNSKLKQLKHIDMDYPPPLDDLPNPQSYGVGSPFNLPPFDSLAPTPLPQQNPFCDESPPGLTPLPPSTTAPPTTAYTPPPFYLSPLLPYQSPPQSPPFDIPSPPETSPMTPSPPVSFPSPPESSPTTPTPPDSNPSPPGGSPTPTLTPPEYSSPSPPNTIPNPPVYVPSPFGYAPSPPSGNEPSPPVYVPGPPGYEPSPPGYDLSPPMYVPSPYAYVPNPPSGGYVPNPPPPSGGGGFVPSPTVFQPPDVFPPPSVPPSPFHKGQGLVLWCVAKPSVPDPIIEEAMNYACGSGAECGSIQPQGSCYRPETLFAHASYAFNSYWQRTKAAGGTCDFGGTAILVTIDPSFDGCHFIAT